MQPTKGKIEELDFIEITNFCGKGHLREMERQFTEWEEIFGNHLPDEDLGYIKSSYDSTTKRQPVKKK